MYREKLFVHHKKQKTVKRRFKQNNPLRTENMLETPRYQALVLEPVNPFAGIPSFMMDEYVPPATTRLGKRRREKTAEEKEPVTEVVKPTIEEPKPSPSKKTKPIPSVLPIKPPKASPKKPSTPTKPVTSIEKATEPAPPPEPAKPSHPFVEQEETEEIELTEPKEEAFVPDPESAKSIRQGKSIAYSEGEKKMRETLTVFDTKRLTLMAKRESMTDSAWNNSIDQLLDELDSSVAEVDIGYLRESRSDMEDIEERLPSTLRDDEIKEMQKLLSDMKVVIQARQIQEKQMSENAVAGTVASKGETSTAPPRGEVLPQGTPAKSQQQYQHEHPVETPKPKPSTSSSKTKLERFEGMPGKLKEELLASKPKFTFRAELTTKTGGTKEKRSIKNEYELADLFAHDLITQEDFSAYLKTYFGKK